MNLNEGDLKRRQLVERIQGPIGRGCMYNDSDHRLDDDLDDESTPCHTDGGVVHPEVWCAALPGLGVWLTNKSERSTQ